MEASLEVAQRFVAATMKDLDAQGRLDRFDQELPLQLKHLRHVRIMYMDKPGAVDHHLAPARRRSQRGRPALHKLPGWFTRLVRPQVVGRAVRVVAVDGSNPIIIVGEPADEIAEAWHDLSSLALVWLALNAVILPILYMVLGRVLDPLAAPFEGHAESRRRSLRAPGSLHRRSRNPRSSPDGSTLSRSRSTRRATRTARLYRQLIAVQEEERHEIANELHDEAGPCLFGITANASSIQRSPISFPTAHRRDLPARRRDFLHRRPSQTVELRAFEETPTCSALESSSSPTFSKNSSPALRAAIPTPQIPVSAFGVSPSSYGEAIDLTLYRCIQEAITNAIRHGKAVRLSSDSPKCPPRGVWGQDAVRDGSGST